MNTFSCWGMNLNRFVMKRPCSQPTFSCAKSTMETPEQYMKNVLVPLLTLNRFEALEMEANWNALSHV